jgi:hypothetical protein
MSQIAGKATELYASFGFLAVVLLSLAVRNLVRKP